MVTLRNLIRIMAGSFSRRWIFKIYQNWSKLDDYVDVSTLMLKITNYH